MVLLSIIALDGDMGKFCCSHALASPLIFPILNSEEKQASEKHKDSYKVGLLSHEEHF